MSEPRLPAANPECTHRWTYSLDRLAWICRTCDYLISDAELDSLHEGDEPMRAAPPADAPEPR